MGEESTLDSGVRVVFSDAVLCARTDWEAKEDQRFASRAYSSVSGENAQESKAVPVICCVHA